MENIEFFPESNIAKIEPICAHYIQSSSLAEIEIGNYDQD